MSSWHLRLYSKRNCILATWLIICFGVDYEIDADLTLKCEKIPIVAGLIRFQLAARVLVYTSAVNGKPGFIERLVERVLDDILTVNSVKYI